ncbi:hypothetical protein F443_23120 [Phytophthora nicotianae P1569]|uniref:Uncharacterized protein n=1 Tax=Phytophthora nicotianae P1569 TaxID=1317065 RepID=V9DTV0_PHYNI|nr:hypothetical protein F443_23120 [Phytophthora nicotianae P1569]
MTHLNFCSVLAASPSRQQTASSFDRLHYGHLGDFADVSTGVADIFLRLSLVPDMYNVHRNKNIEEVAELPLITMVVNCHLWMTYGYATDSLFPLLGSQLVRSLVYYTTLYTTGGVPRKSANAYASFTRSPLQSGVSSRSMSCLASLACSVRPSQRLERLSDTLDVRSVSRCSRLHSLR